MSEQRDLRAVATRHGLDPARVRVRSVISPGGFTNRLYRVDDGRRSLRVKITGEAPGPWLPHHERLHRDHGAPRLLEALPWAGGTVLILEDIPGRRLRVGERSPATFAALAAAARLHHDTELAAELGPPRTCAEDAIAVYVTRLWADLADPMPEFLDIRWATAEVDALEADLRRGAAFAAPAGAAVHGDLYGANVIVGPEGDIRILDWDDFHGGGDPALDATMLLGPLLLRGRGGILLARYAGWTGDPSIVERAPLYRRALLLSDIIDTLSDYAASERSDVRAAKLRAHQIALGIYSGQAGTP